MDLMQALAVVDSVADRAMETQERTPQLAEALAYFRDLGIERETLVWFWKCLANEHVTIRGQSANAARNRIRFLVNERRRALKEALNPCDPDW